MEIFTLRQKQREQVKESPRPVHLTSLNDCQLTANPDCLSPLLLLDYLKANSRHHIISSVNASIGTSKGSFFFFKINITAIPLSYLNK